MVQEDNSPVNDLDEIEGLSLSNEKIEKRRLRPLTSSLDFDLSHRPTQARDRVSKKRVWAGIFFGFLMIGMGLLVNFTSPSSFLDIPDTNAPISMMTAFSASWLFVGLGLFIIATRVLLMFYGRDFFIGHKFAAVVIQKPFETGQRQADSLDGYIGVRYRSRIVNVLGLTSFTQHIIDLQHPNETKTIPLYISNNGDGVSKKWEELARQMQMPAIFNTADGIIEIAPEDIQKSLPDLIKEGKIKVCEKDLYKLPHSFNIVEEADSCQIDPLIRDSAFSKTSALLCLCAFFITAFLGFAVTVGHHEPLPFIPLLLAAIVLFVLIPLALFFRKKRIVISKNGIRIKSKWLGIPSFGFLIPMDKLESLHVVHNSYDFKYSLVIGADGQTTHIGRGLPKDDLKWLENFINAHIKHFTHAH